MKIVQIYPITLFTIAFALILSGCTSFLEEYSQDERAPKTTGDYSEILFGEAYFKRQALPFTYLELLTDDVSATSNLANINGDDTRQEAFGYYTWQTNPEVSPRGTHNADRTWEELYHHILIANVILSKLESMVGTEAEKAQLEGEAYAIKLHAYFMLTNLYGQPYDPTTANRALGVPINNHSHSEDTSFPRATVKENYDEMIKCLEGAIRAFERSNNSPSTFRWNRTAVAIMGSRLYLYMQDWDSAIKYANLAISLNPSLYNLNTKTPNIDDNENNAFISKNNKEISFQQGFFQSKYLSTANKFYFTASKDLLSQYKKGDLRYYDNKGEFIRAKKVRVGGGWFNPIYEYFVQAKKNGSDSRTGAFGYTIRSAEAYLNRAEAYAHKSETEKAIADIKQLREARIQPEYSSLPAFGSSEELLMFVREERRRELCFEYHRWFDLRRWHQPGITHSYITSSDKDEERQDFHLAERDPRYTLPVPQQVLESDKSLTEKN